MSESRKKLSAYWRVEDRFIDSGIPYDQLPKKTYEGPPYDVSVIPHIFERMWEGHSLSAILRDDPTLPRHGEFISYIRRYPDLWEMYMDAKVSRAEVMVDRLEYAINGKDNDGERMTEDVQWARLRYDGFKWMASVFNRDAYGEKKQIDVNNRLDLTEAMRHGEARVERLEKVIEGEILEEDEAVRMLGLDE